MTSQEFDKALSELRWSGSSAAQRLKVTPKAVSAWRTGKVGVPGPVAAFVRLSLAVKRIAAEVAGKLDDVIR